MTMLSDAVPEQPSGQRDKMLGIACGMAAGALWGLVFLAPEISSSFGPLQISVARYLCYGAIAALLLAPRFGRVLASVPKPVRWNLLWLAAAGNTVYYLLLSGAVQKAGIAITSLIVGFLPVAVTLIGSRDQNAVPLKKLAPSLILSALGSLCIGARAFERAGQDDASEQLLGIVYALGALFSWTAFAIGNTRCLKQLDKVSALDWNLLIGLVTGAQCLLLAPFAFTLDDTQHTQREWTEFFGVALSVALCASIVANALWNRTSRLLPMTLAGQMILFETLCALIYGWLWEQRLPTSLELVALFCLVGSVVSCLAAHRTRAPEPEQPMPESQPGQPEAARGA